MVVVMKSVRLGMIRKRISKEPLEKTPQNGTSEESSIAQVVDGKGQLSVPTGEKTNPQVAQFVDSLFQEFWKQIIKGRQDAKR